MNNDDEDILEDIDIDELEETPLQEVVDNFYFEDNIIYDT